MTKELFQLLTRDLFRPDYGMFTYSQESRTCWFNPASLETELEFALVGGCMQGGWTQLCRRCCSYAALC